MKARRTRSRRGSAVNLGDHSGCLRLVAFSDYRSQDVEILIKELSKIQPQPDLILYAGDDIARFRPPGKNLFEAIASYARYGLCAIAGNDDLPSSRSLISGKSVFNVHSNPVTLGEFAILGVDGAPFRSDLQGIGFLLHSEAEIKRHLGFQVQTVGPRRLLVLSHTPPDGVLDQAVRFSPNGKPRSIGSRAVKSFLKDHKNAALLVCGHVHRCGGKHVKLSNSVVVNAANHDDFESIGRLALIEIEPAQQPTVQWRVLRPVSMIPGIGPVADERLARIGVRTVEELSACPIGDLRGAVPSPELISARARAIVQNTPISLGLPYEKPNGVEVFLDIETDLSQTYIWLIGLCVGREGQYKRFFAQTPKRERRILAELLTFMEAYPAARIVTCSGCRFEERIIRMRLAAHDLPTAICGVMDDMHPNIRRSVALPTSSYKVKEVGAFFGYQYKHPELDGFAVGSLYEQRYRKLRDVGKRRKLAKKLIEYNEDDVRCLPFILNALDRLASENLGR